MGTVVSSRQRAADKLIVAAGKPLPRRRLAVGPLTAGAVAVLVCGSIVYHTHFPL
jgi:hypothetical protein